jgi:hypothetical protein
VGKTRYIFVWSPSPPAIDFIKSHLKSANPKPSEAKKILEKEKKSQATFCKKMQKSYKKKSRKILFASF